MLLTCVVRLAASCPLFCRVFQLVFGQVVLHLRLLLGLAALRFLLLLWRIVRRILQ